MKNLIKLAFLLTALLAFGDVRAQNKRDSLKHKIKVSADSAGRKIERAFDTLASELKQTKKLLDFSDKTAEALQKKNAMVTALFTKSLDSGNQSRLFVAESITGNYLNYIDSLRKRGRCIQLMNNGKECQQLFLRTNQTHDALVMLISKSKKKPAKDYEKLLVAENAKGSSSSWCQDNIQNVGYLDVQAFLRKLKLDCINLEIAVLETL